MKRSRQMHASIAVACGVTAAILMLSAMQTVHAQSDVGPGVCVDDHPDAPPCEDQSWSYDRTYIDPAQREAERRAREAEREERRRIREVRRKNRTPYKGVRIRQTEMRKDVGHGFSDLMAQVKAVTYERAPGYSGEILVPDPALGNVALARPVNPTLRETQVAAEQLAKTGAVMNFLDANPGSAEDAAFLADQGAQIMVGGRSYVHVNVTRSFGYARSGGDGWAHIENTAPEITNPLNAISTLQVQIRKSEIERAAILEDAKSAISELAGVHQKIETAPAGRTKARLEARAQKLASDLDVLEQSYFDKLSEEKALEEEIIKKKKDLIRRVRWKKDDDLQEDNRGPVRRDADSDQR